MSVPHWLIMLEYERQATARAIASLRTVPMTPAEHPDSARARGVLAHAIMARHEWLSRLGAIEKRAWVMFPDWTIDQLETDAARLDAAWSAYLVGLDEAALARVVVYHAFDGTGYSSTVAEVLTHVFNHSTYHRGQVAMLVKQAGGQPASTDFIALTRKRLQA